MNIEKNIYHRLYWFFVNNITIKRYYGLANICKRIKAKRYVEIGVFEGRNIYKLQKLCPDLTIIGVDPYKAEEYRNDTKDTKYYARKQTEYDKLYERIKKDFVIIRKPSILAANSFIDESQDVVFIDAIHTKKAVMQDIKAWLPKVRKGGYLCGHDYSIKYFGVLEGVNEMLGVDNIQVLSDDVWVYLKK